MIAAWICKLRCLLGMATDLRDLAIAVSALVVVLVVGSVGVVFVRWRLRKMQQDVTAEPFTLEQLRKLYQRGELTEQEYARAKDKMAGRVGLDAEVDHNLAERQKNLRSEEGTSSS